MPAGSPMLFAPPLAPVRIEPGRAITLGRSTECTLQLPAAGASRRHACIDWHEGRARLRDLGSTNGTFVNGERIAGATLLASGDRIRIGGFEVVYCCVEAGTAVANLDDSRTVVSHWPERHPASEALRGDLARVPLFAVLQMLEMGGQSGCLAVQSDDGGGSLWLDAGRVVHAETAKATGLDAALAIAQASAGHFDFAPGHPPREYSFGTSVTELILEATRLLDEAEALG